MTDKNANREKNKKRRNIGLTFLNYGIKICTLILIFYGGYYTQRQTKILDYAQRANIRAYLSYDEAENDSCVLKRHLVQENDTTKVVIDSIRNKQVITNEGNSQAYIELFYVNIIPEPKEVINIREDSLLKDNITRISVVDIEKYFSKVVPAKCSIKHYYEWYAERNIPKSQGKMYLHVLILYRDIYNGYHDIYNVYKIIYRYSENEKRVVSEIKEPIYDIYKYTKDEIEKINGKEKTYKYRFGS
jgi:hypothetical protein